MKKEEAQVWSVSRVSRWLLGNKKRSGFSLRTKADDHDGLSSRQGATPLVKMHPVRCLAHPSCRHQLANGPQASLSIPRCLTGGRSVLTARRQHVGRPGPDFGPFPLFQCAEHNPFPQVSGLHRDPQQLGPQPPHPSLSQSPGIFAPPTALGCRFASASGPSFPDVNTHPALCGVRFDCGGGGRGLF